MAAQKPRNSFNTFRFSRYETRNKLMDKARYVLYAMGVIAALLILTLLISGIIDLFSQDEPVETKEIQYQNLTRTEDKLSEGTLAVISAKHSLTAEPATTNLVELTEEGGYYISNSSYSLYLQSEAATMLAKMAKAYQATASTLTVTDAYRSFEQQKGKTLDAGCSDHHTGYLVTFDSADTDALNWLNENAYKYGFVVRYPAKDLSNTGVSDYTNAFHYVGVVHATYMHQNSLCLEAYVDYLAKNTSTENHLTVTADGRTYEIYNVPKTGEITTVSVPKDLSYTVSGDNIQGFIVTMDVTDFNEQTGGN